MTLTPTQTAAVSASGNVVVIAGAGTGKTRTLVERCLQCLLHSSAPADLSEILVVTFTEAAAAEMRQRLRDRLQEYSGSAGVSLASCSRSQEHLALFETAHIGTLHSFCLELARRHFYLLELDPQFTVMSQEEARLLANEQLDALFAEKYSEKSPEAEAVRELIASHGDGSDQSIRALALRLHEYSQTLPDPEGWMNGQLKAFSGSMPGVWCDWLTEALADFRREWLPRLQEMAATNGLARECLPLLQSAQAPNRTSPPEAFVSSFGAAGGASVKNKSDCGRGEEALSSIIPASTRESLLAIVATSKKCPTGKKGAWLEPLEDLYKDSKYLLSLLPKDAGSDPLAEDWSWLRKRVRTVLALASEFTQRFGRAKRDLALADFHDLEQFALRLLWDNTANAPTKIAEQWRATFLHVMVDEYQDINAAQDQILRALSRDGDTGNRFLVGDLKQSIYRFRLAAPRIFQAYVRQWGGPRDVPAGSTSERGTVIPLSENFRSRERILDFINSMFALLMIEEVGGLTYEENARLRFGAPNERRLLAAQPSDPRVEFHFRKRASRRGENGDDDANDGESLADLEEAAKEARLVALRLRELHASGHQIWDDHLQNFRPVQWNDMAILLRAPSKKLEFYVREFARLSVPLAAARGGFYESTEISDLHSLLTILDNPLQDLPLLAVLRSPIVGLSLEELAQIRLEGDGPFWTALLAITEFQAPPGADNPKGIASSSPGLRGTSYPGSDQTNPPNPERVLSLPKSPTPPRAGTLSTSTTKISRFLERFSRWRSFTRQMSLSSCLEEILSETRYSDWLLTQPRGEERLANLQGLVNLARKLDQFQRQGLLRFLLFIEAQRSAETEPPVPSVSDENAVRLMSIHQSKGLEFPVVVLADTAKPFNLQDLKSEIILDDVYGICPLIKPPKSAKRYPSLPYWLARRRQRKEILGEELRLLYVAMTRARDTLILTSSLSESSLNKLSTPSGRPVSDSIASARSVADWLTLWFSKQEPASPNVRPSAGQTQLTRYTIHDDSTLAAAERGWPSRSSNELAAAPETSKASTSVERAAVGPAALHPESPPPFLTDPARLQVLEKKLTWLYPYPSSTRQTAKSSVSLLRREAAQEDEETAQYFNFQPPTARIHFAKAADAGTATHALLQRVSLDHVGSVAKLQAETARLVKEKILTPEAAALINLENVARFWQAPLGKTIQSQAAHVQRELAFTAKIHLREIASILGTDGAVQEPDDFVIIQGIVDVVLLLPDSLRIIDFKTDNVAGKALTDRAKQYEPQLKLYALALSRIYKRPVSTSWLYFLAAAQAIKIPSH